MGTLIQDLRFGLRMLAKNPGFTAVAVLTLALGIGANTAIFSVVNAVLLRPLPYVDPDRLVAVQSRDPRQPGNRTSLSYPNFFDFRRQNHVFEHLVTYRDNEFTLTGVGEALLLNGEMVSWGLFPTLGVQPALGRGFLPQEEAPGAHVVVLSHDLWQRQFGRDPGIVGRTITLNRLAFTVVGVAPASFRFPVDNPAIQLWTTIAVDAEAPAAGRPLTEQRGARFLPGLARLKPGVTIERARAEMDSIAAALAKQYPDTNTRAAATVIIPEADRLVGKTRKPLMILLGAVGMVLLIACANIANLLLARNAGRGHEIAMRAALGATRWRVVRQLLTESLVLALLGSGLGALLAQSTLQAILPLGGNSIPRLAQTSIDERVLSFSVALAFLATLVFGLVPALQASKLDLAGSLKEGARASTGGHDGLRRALVVTEITLGLVLVTIAGLLMASLVRLMKGNLGIKSDHVLTFWFSLPGAQYSQAQQVQFYDRLLERVRALPGVQSAAGVWPLPLGGDSATVAFDIQERPAAPSNRPFSDMAFATPEYFATAGIPLIKGRVFTERDDAASPPVLVVNKAFVDRFFPDEDVIGKRIEPGATTGAGGTRMHEIVGVVGNAKLSALKSMEETPIYYFPYKQLPWQPPVGMLRASVPPRSLESAIRQQVSALDPLVPVYQVRTMDDLLSLQTAGPRFVMILLVGFAAIALSLIIAGVYGVTAYWVERRTREIGIRVALGASRSDVVSMVMKQVTVMVLAGLLLGMAGAIAGARVIRSLLFDLAPENPLVPILACSLVALTAALASYIPARRATKVDPMVALRYE